MRELGWLHTQDYSGQLSPTLTGTSAPEVNEAMLERNAYDIAKRRGENEEAYKERLHKQFGFDPDGLSEPINALKNPFDTMTVGAVTWLARNAADEHYNNDRKKKDAFRHIYASYLLTMLIDEDGAKEFGDAHERYSDNSDPSRMKNLHNNQLGRHLRARAKIPLSQLTDEIKKLIESDKAVVKHNDRFKFEQNEKLKDVTKRTF